MLFLFREDPWHRYATWIAACTIALFLVANGLLLFLCFHIPFGAIVRAIYNFNTILAPILFACSSLVILILTRKKPTARVVRGIALLELLLAVSMAVTRIYATHIEPTQLQVREVVVYSPKITRPFSLLHISDIQSAGIGPYEAKVFNTIRALNPDLILDTGDLLQPAFPNTYRSELPKLAELFRTLSPPLGMFTSEGDTTGPINDASADETGGIEFLRSHGKVIDVDGLRLRIFGLTLYNSTPAGSPAIRPVLKSWLEKEPDTLNIVFGHRPDYILSVNDLPIDLCLAGHTHGGQIRLPFIGPLITFTRIPKEWARGFREVGQTRLNVSAGIGAEHAHGLPSIRINCPPEMTMIRCKPAIH